MSLQKVISEPGEFLKYIEKNPVYKSFFSQFSPRSLFSPNWKTLVQCFEKMHKIPPELTEFDPSIGMSIFCKYLILIVPSFFTNEFLKKFYVLMDKLRQKDINFLVYLVTTRINTQQKINAIYQLPDCDSTFYFLGSLFSEKDIFLIAFQRIYSSYHLVSENVRIYINKCLEKSLLMGPANEHIIDITEICLDHSNISKIKKSESGFNPIMLLIEKTFPISLSKCEPTTISKFFSLVLMKSDLPLSILNLLFLTNTQLILNFPQILNFLNIAPSLLFEYINMLPQNKCQSSWYLILVKVSHMVMDYPYQNIILSIFFHLLTALKEKKALLISTIPSTNILEWFSNFIKNFTNNNYNLTLFGIFLIILRCFDDIAKITFEKTNFIKSFETALNSLSDKISISNIIFWSMNPNSKKFPYHYLIDNHGIDDITFPPPSSFFLFHIIPEILAILFKVAIDDSTPKNQPKVNHTPLRIIKNSEVTHSKISLHVDDCENEQSENSIEQSVKNPIEELSDNIISSYSFVPNVKPFLKHLISSLITMYENEELLSFLYSLSSSQILIPFIPFAHSDDDCFNFLTRALGLSCSFLVFRLFFEQISDNFQKSLRFLSKLAEYSQLVSDFLYVTSEIPLTVSTANTIVLWVRPLSESTILTISNSKNQLSVSLSKEELTIHSLLYKKIPPKIGGWVMVSLSFLSSNTLIISINLSSFKITLPYDIFPYQSVIIGDNKSHFDLQSVRIFKTLLTDNDILYLFALGPNYQELITSSFLSIPNQKPTYVTNSGFISELYLPFFDAYDLEKEIETQALSFLEISLSPPFKSVRHFSKTKVQNNNTYFVDRRRSYLFINVLHCHGGMDLLIHYIGEVILKQPQLNCLLWPMVSKLISYYPNVNNYLESTHAYALVGHLLWSGTTNVYETISLGFQKEKERFYIINPSILKHWVFEAQLFYVEMEDIINYMINSMETPKNLEILEKINAFEKIIDLLCRTNTHSSQFLSLLGNFAIKLTNATNAQSHSKLVFDRLMLCYFSFAQKNKHVNESNLSSIRMNSFGSSKTETASLNAVQLIRILQLILSEFTEVKIELELFLTAIITSTPAVQVAIIVLLIQHMESKYFHLLSYVLKKLSYIEGIENSLFALLTSNLTKLSFIKLTTCFVYFSTHKECQVSLPHLCSFAEINLSIPQDDVQISLNQILECISVSESSEGLLHFDDSPIITSFITFLLYKAISISKSDTVFEFFLCLYTIPNLSLHRLAIMTFFLIEQTFKLINENPLSSNLIDKIFDNCCIFTTYLIHQSRLTPGAIDDELLDKLSSLTMTLMKITSLINSPDAFSRYINFLIALFHIELPKQISSKIISEINDMTKLQKQKRYPELVERVDETINIPERFVIPFEQTLQQLSKKWYMTDETDRINLFSLSCRSIHAQTLISMGFHVNDTDSDYIIDLWHKIFHTLQFPGSYLYSQCPVKWMVSGTSSTIQQRLVLLPMNPSIDKLYDSYWNVKYSENPPKVRLKLQEVLQYTPISLHNAKDVRFSSHAMRLTGISSRDGVFVVTDQKIRFYQRCKASVQFCEDVLTIQISKIDHIKFKSFRHQPTGIEILCKDTSCYIFDFDTANLKDLFIDIISSFNVKIIKNIKFKDLEAMSKKWAEGSISNFDYLMYLNILSGRSFNDFTQYPIMPWILNNYSSDTIDFNNQEIYRDLSLPIFAQTPEQQEQCIKYYNTTINLGSEPHCTPNYFSNVGSTLYFLVRVEPFTDEEIFFQSGSLDAADRTFQSFDISFKLMTSPGNKNALELTPEFYFNPEVFKNSNMIKFPISPITKRIVSDVALPKWANSYRDFIQKMRYALESPFVSQNLNEWIDLVWGYRRRGELAYEKFNVFPNHVFEFNPTVISDDRVLLKAIKDQIHNCGQAALMLFKTPHIKKVISAPILKQQGSLKYKNTKKSSTPSDSWVYLKSSKSSIKAVRLFQGSLETNKNGIISTEINFSDEINISCFDIQGSMIATGHIMPVVNLWKIKDNIKFMESLRCHLSGITSITFFHEEWSMLAVGHDDGCVSIFTVNISRFIRVLEPELIKPVTLIRTSLINGDILVIQNTILTLWSINGEKVNFVQMENTIIDAKFTAYTDGIHNNFVVILCSDNSLFILNSFDLDITEEIKLDKKSPVSISISKDNDTLKINYKDGYSTFWSIL